MPRFETNFDTGFEKLLDGLGGWNWKNGGSKSSQEMMKEKDVSQPKTMPLRGW